MAKTILIVDDNAYIRLALCELFKPDAVTTSEGFLGDVCLAAFSATGRKIGR